MSLTITTKPQTLISGAYYSRWNAAYNPFVFVFTQAGLPVGATSPKVVAQILDKTGALVSSHEAFIFDTVAYLDVSKIVQAMFTDLSTYNENSYFNDASLYAGFTIKYAESYYTAEGVLVQSEWFYTDKFFAVRGVVQIPENPNYYDSVYNLLIYDQGALFSSTGLLLTMFTDRILPVWAGYPRDVAFIMTEFSDTISLNRYASGVENITAATQDGVYPGYVARLELSTNPGHTYPWTTVYLRDYAHNTHACSQVYTLDNRTAGRNPFYIRWRNPLGGFDYWLFEKRQEITATSSDTQTVERDLTLFSSARSTHKVYRRRGSLSYLVGATNLSAVEWEALNSIQLSSRIEYWDGTNWIEIIPEDGDNLLINDKPAGEIEYQFFFPERQIAY
jgi:hypothetical protein